jgi:molecular chaperone GrpE (heat shock protein)
LLGPVGLIGAGAIAAVSLVLKLIGASKKKERQEEQIEQNINKLKSELVKLKERRLRITSEIEKIKG